MLFLSIVHPAGEKQRLSLFPRHTLCYPYSLAGRLSLEFGSMGPVDALGAWVLGMNWQRYGERLEGNRGGGGRGDPKEKGVDADRSSGWILALEAEREDGLRPYASPSPSQVKRKLWEPREELSAGSCSCCFLMLAPFKSPLLHGS